MRSWHLLVISMGLLILPQWAWAKQEPLDWKTHGLIALTIAVVISVFLVMRNQRLDSKTAKIMVFGIYFWLIIFAQAILYGVYYGMFR